MGEQIILQIAAFKFIVRVNWAIQFQNFAVSQCDNLTY